jgi:inorganic pyrophosphatase
MKYTAIIEQTYHYSKRMKYIPETASFIEKDHNCLSYVRNVIQPYGWIEESGTPPKPHLDVIVMTDNEYELGDKVSVRIIGVFLRNDGDNKLVAVTDDRSINDLTELMDKERNDLHRLFPLEDIGEGWFGKKEAKQVIDKFMVKHS